MKKTLFVVIAIAVIGIGAIAAIVIYAFSNADALIKQAVEEIGPDVTQTSVRLDNVDIDLTSGKGALSGLQIGNPAGFEADYALKLSKISVNVDVDSIDFSALDGSLIIIKEVIIDGPDIIYEMLDGDTNMDAIQRNVDAYIKDIVGDSDQGDSSEAVKVIIRDLYIRNGQIAVSSMFLAGQQIGTGLPDIHLTNLGKDMGATPGEIAADILSAMTGGIGAAVDVLNVQGLIDAASNAGEAVSDVIEEVVGGKVGDVLDQGASGAGGAVEEGAKKAGDVLNNLLGN